MDDAEHDVLAYMTFPPQHRTKLHSTDVINKTLLASSAVLPPRGRPRGEERAHRLEAPPGSLRDLAKRRRPRISVRASPAASARPRGAGAGGRRRGAQVLRSTCVAIRPLGGRSRQAATNCS